MRIQVIEVAHEYVVPIYFQPQVGSLIRDIPLPRVHNHQLVHPGQPRRLICNNYHKLATKPRNLTFLSQGTCKAYRFVTICFTMSLLLVCYIGIRLKLLKQTCLLRKPADHSGKASGWTPGPPSHQLKPSTWLALAPHRKLFGFVNSFNNSNSSKNHPQAF